MTDIQVKATIVIGNKTVMFEGPPEFVDRQVEKYTMEMTSVLQGKQVDDASSVRTATETASERQLVSTKRPGNHSETVAALAFWLAQNGKEIFSEDDIKRAYIRADLRPPKVISQAIRDAKNNFDFVEPGPERGTWRLTNHGERTVRHDLPASN